MQNLDDIKLKKFDKLILVITNRLFKMKQSIWSRYLNNSNKLLCRYAPTLCKKPLIYIYQ